MAFLNFSIKKEHFVSDITQVIASDWCSMFNSIESLVHYPDRFGVDSHRFFLYFSNLLYGGGEGYTIEVLFEF